MKFCLTHAGMCEVAAPISVSRAETLLEQIKAGTKIIMEHINRHKVIYRIGAITLIVLLGGMDVAFAADSTIDAGATKIYSKLVNVGKWVIIIKGAFDTINSTVQGDFIQARKSFLAYLLVYVVLLGLPWAFAQVEMLFTEMT